MKRRSWLFVPGDSARKLDKVGDSGADVVIVDLEDSVAPDRKKSARKLTGDWLAGRAAAQSPELWVRINPVSAGLYREDLDAIVAAAPAGVVLPKPDSVEDIRKLDQYLARLEGRYDLVEGTVRVLAIVTETAAGVLSLPGYSELPQRVWGLTWGAEDLAADLGASTNRQNGGEFSFTFRLARSLCQLTAAAAGLPVIETVLADFRDAAALRRYAEAGRRDGFVGMMAIHPNQVDIINRAFTPSPEEVAFARRVIEAFGADSGTGVVSLDGKMLDRPHLRQAERILQMAD